MHLILVRHTKLSDRTLGALYIDSKYFCDTLEDTDRGLTKDSPLDLIKKIKVWGMTAIPRGVYELVISYSNRFKKLLPEVLDVPGFLGIRIHNGNNPEHSHGCVLVGKRSGNVVINSITTMSKLMPILEAAVKKQKITFTIIDTEGQAI